MRITKQSRFILSLPSLLIAVCCLLTFVGGFIYATQVGAASEKVTGKRMVTIHDDGHDRGILTSATTLRQVLKEAHIALDPHDTVEPGLDEPLVDRNYDANIYRARPVTVIDGNIREKIMTSHRAPEQVAEDAGITLHDEDTAKFSRTTGMVSDGAGVDMTIDRATPFTLVLYGKTIQAYTQAKTVGAMLKSKDIHLESEDTLSVSQDAPITANMRVELWRNGTQTLNQEEDVPFKIKQTEDPNRPVGYKQITTPGVKGTKNVTYEVIMKNGKEVSRKEIQSVVTKQPKAQEEIIGTKLELPAGSHTDWMREAGMDPSNYDYISYIFTGESHWNPAAVNPYGYSGLGQTNQATLASACPNWQSDPVCQIRFFNGYAVSRYGSWEAAATHWQQNKSW